MSTPIGERGRTPPGESWRRAMDEAARRIVQGSRGRYRIRARLIEPGWWAYDLQRISSREPAAKDAATPLTKDRVAAMARELPRCAQRSRAMHGGNSKVAWPAQALAYRVAVITGGKVYRCPLAAPALGEHWHIATTRKTKRR